MASNPVEDHVCNSIVLDSTHAISELCVFCANSGTDKCVLRLDSGGHRHPYTVPYSLLFETMRRKPIKFLELGVFRGASIIAWRQYFSKARIYGYDNDVGALSAIPMLPDVQCTRVDVSQRDELVAALSRDTADGELFDIVLDDAAHDVVHQSLLIREGLRFVKPGGLLIIEDVFRDRPESLYAPALEAAIAADLLSFYTFIVCDHRDRYSPGWNNDKMLVLFRK
jgi:SAM-dependent methyltransferase